MVIYSDRLVPAPHAGCTRGPMIFIRPAYRDDQGLLAHERVHVRQWLAGILVAAALALALWLAVPGWAVLAQSVAVVGLGLHPLVRLVSRRYRLWSEVEAYREQLKHYPIDHSMLFAVFLAERYGLGVSVDSALQLLKEQ